MNWPYPSENQDPWYDVFKDMVLAQDASGHAAREDRNVFMGGGGIVSFTATTGVLAWAEDFEIFSPEVGFLFTAAASNVVLQDGQLCYADLVRSPTGNLAVALAVANQVPQSDTAYVIALRRGTTVYFRFGTKIGDGDSLNPFEGRNEADTDTYERSATFSIPDLSSTPQEATLGRTSYGGSLVAVSLELTEAVISGTITVTIKRDGTPTLVAILDAGNPTAIQTVATVGTWPVSSNSALTVLVEPSVYDNVAGTPGGLTVNVTLTTGLTLSPTEIADASTTLKGVSKLSVTPVTANDPIVAGDNDPRLSDKRVASGIGTTGATVVVDSAAPPLVGQVFTATSPTSGTWQTPVAGGAGSDTTAIHNNVAAEINALATKATPVAADVIVIEDSADTFNKKKITLTDLIRVSIYERNIEAVVAQGTAAEVEYTTGHATYSGSAIGVSVSLNDSVTAGTVTVKVKVATVTVLTAVLSVGSPTFARALETIGVAAVSFGDSIVIGIETSGLTTTGGGSPGITVNTTLVAVGL